MRCPKCGNNLDENDKVCDFCGYVVEQKPVEYSNFFPNKVEENKKVEEDKPRPKIDVVKIIFIVAILACVVYIVLVGLKWLDNKKPKANDSIPTTPVNNNGNKQNEEKDKPKNGTETIVDNNGYRYIIPAYYNVYKNTEAYVEIINNNDKVNIIMYKPLDMEYSLIKTAPEAYTTNLKDRGMTILKNLEKFYNNTRYYVIYCKSGNDNYYLVFTSFNGKTISFGITDYGSNKEDDLFDVIDMILADATAIS